MQETKKNQSKVHLEVVNLQDKEGESCYYLSRQTQLSFKIESLGWKETTKTSVLEKQRTITPTSFVSVIPLTKNA